MPSGLGPMRQETAQLRQWAKRRASHHLTTSPDLEITHKKIPITLECRLIKQKDGSRKSLYCFSDDRSQNEFGGISQEFEDLFDLAEALTAVLEGLSS